MRFATILREAGFSTDEFKKCAEIPIILYDRKDRTITDENIHFIEKLFKDNPDALEKFHTFLTELENTPPTSTINIRIDESAVFVFYKTQNCRIFLRHSKNSMDFME